MCTQNFNNAWYYCDRNINMILWDTEEKNVQVHVIRTNTNFKRQHIISAVRELQNHRRAQRK